VVALRVKEVEFEESMVVAVSTSSVALDTEISSRKTPRVISVPMKLEFSVSKTKRSRTGRPA
jgi:hypothetical protein